MPLPKCNVCTKLPISSHIRNKPTVISKVNAKKLSFQSSLNDTCLSLICWCDDIVSGGMIYWVDSPILPNSDAKIEVSDFDGNNRQVIHTTSTGNSYLDAIAIYQDFIFIADSNNQ